MTQNTSFKIPTSFINNLDYLVHLGFFNSRGEAIRIAIEDYITVNYGFLFIEKEKEKKNIDKLPNELILEHN